MLPHNAYLTIGRHQDVLDGYPDMFFDSLVTDPPYGLKFMGHKWDYQVPTVADWQCIIKKMKPGAYGLVFCGTRTQHRMVVNLEDAGFEIRDVITWVYSTGFPKNMQVDRPGWGTALKPATEFITLIRAPMIGTTKDNLRTHGVGAIHIDACRVAPTGESLDGGDVKYRGKKKSASEGWDRPWMNDEEALRARAERGTAAQVKGENMGRYPANFIHDGSAEVIEMFPGNAGAASPIKKEYSGKSKGKYNDFAKKGGNPDTFYNDSGSAARFFKTCEYSLREEVFRYAKTILEEWNPNLAHTVDNLSSLSAKEIDFALKNAVTVASLAGKQLKDFQGLTIPVTPMQLKRIVEALIAQILYLEKNVSPELQQGEPFPNGVLANTVETQKQTDIITITINLLKSNGCADLVTFNIMRLNSEVGEKDSKSLEPDRFMYCAKPAPSERNAGTSDGNDHPTVKPMALMRYLVRLITPVGGTCLDPYAGSGTTGCACYMEGMNSVLIDQEPEHELTIRERLAHWKEIAEKGVQSTLW